MFFLFLLCAGCAARAQTAFPGAPSFAEARAVCKAVADGSAAFIEPGDDEIIHADIDNDGVEDSVRIDHQQTFVSAQIKVRDQTGEFEDFFYETNLDMGVAPYPPWDREFHFMRVGARVYGVSFSSSGPNWVAYARQDYETGAPWLCRFEMTTARAPANPPPLDFPFLSRVSRYNPALYSQGR